MIERIARSTAISCVVIAIAFAIWRGSAWAAIAVFGGGFLIAISFWAIAQTVDKLMPAASVSRRSPEGAKADETGQKTAVFTLVKFFTRHAIVALAAYGMMVRLHLDAMGVLAGVTSLGVAVGLEALRDLRWRRFP